jgi:hypothetical protein
MQYGDRMDHECIALCDALNKIPSLETFSSCCGHSKTEFFVILLANKESSEFLRSTLPLGWLLSSTGSKISPDFYRLSGPVDANSGDYLAVRISAAIAERTR